MPLISQITDFFPFCLIVTIIKPCYNISHLLKDPPFIPHPNHATAPYSWSTFYPSEKASIFTVIILSHILPWNYFNLVFVPTLPTPFINGFNTSIKPIQWSMHRAPFSQCLGNNDTTEHSLLEMCTLPGFTDAAFCWFSSYFTGLSFPAFLAAFSPSFSLFPLKTAWGSVHCPLLFSTFLWLLSKWSHSLW